jgi:hypothetical protein
MNWSALLTNESVENTREVMEGGKRWLVAPAAIIPHGVMSGSKGPLYYPAEESAKTAHLWDKIPITIQHPFDPTTGSPLSANDAGVMERQEVGEVRSPLHDGKTRAELWFDADKTLQKSPETYAALKRKEKIPLSTGLYTDNIHSPGVHDGVEYVARATNHRPDHLAILPGGRGACHVDDGCGVNVTNAATCSCGGVKNSEGVCNMCGAKATGERAQNADPATLFSALLYGAVVAHQLHLKTKSFAAHSALGELYKALPDLTDSLVESYQGKNGVVESYPQPSISQDDPVSFVKSLSEVVQSNRAAIGPDTELQNIVDEITGLLDKTMYKLKTLNEWSDAAREAAAATRAANAKTQSVGVHGSKAAHAEASKMHKEAADKHRAAGPEGNKLDILRHDRDAKMHGIEAGTHNSAWDKQNAFGKQESPEQLKATGEKHRKAAEACRAAGDEDGYGRHTALADSADMYAGGALLNSAASLSKKALETGIAKDHQAAADALRKAAPKQEGGKREMMLRAAAEHESASTTPQTEDNGVVNMWKRLWELVANAPAKHPSSGKFIAAKELAQAHFEKGWKDAHPEQDELPEENALENPNPPEAPEKVDALGVPVKNIWTDEAREAAAAARKASAKAVVSGSKAHHREAMIAHETAAFHAVKDMDHSAAGTHFEAANGHAKAMTSNSSCSCGGSCMKCSTANKEFTSDEERKAAFAHMNDGGSDTQAAKAGSDRANKTGKAGDHAKAAALHKEAASTHKEKGNDEMAKAHASAARYHGGKATNNEGTMNRDQALAALTVNCKCQADRAALNNLSDGALIALATNKEFTSDEERKAAFAHMNDGGSDTQAAKAGSERAAKTGKAADHTKAAALHREAALTHRENGNKEMAKAHSDSAKSHSQSARMATNADEEDDELGEEEDGEFEENKLTPKKLMSVVNHLGRVERLTRHITDLAKREKMVANLSTKSSAYLDNLESLLPVQTMPAQNSFPALLPLFGAPTQYEEQVDNAAPELQEVVTVDYTQNASPGLIARLKQQA